VEHENYVDVVLIVVGVHEQPKDRLSRPRRLS
jgi:hypothetical protein